MAHTWWASELRLQLNVQASWNLPSCATILQQHERLEGRFWDYQLGRPSWFGSCKHMLICPDTMSAYPRFFSQPFRYLRWAAIEKPAIFYSIVIGSLGPVTIFVVPPIRTMLGDPKRPEIPLTYPSTIRDSTAELQEQGANYMALQFRRPRGNL